jgi:hypothetical protein
MIDTEEQNFYNDLKKKSIPELVKRIREIEIITYNLKRECDMIRNILILMGEDVPSHYITDFEWGKFYSTESEENHGTETKER